MSTSTSPSTADLIKMLSVGQVGAHAGLARELALRWGRYLGATVEIVEEGNPLRFVTQLSGTYLHGMGDVPCLLIFDDSEPAVTALGELLRQTAGNHCLAIIIALSAQSQDLARRVVPMDRAVVIDAGVMTKLMEAQEPRAVLKEQVRLQVSRRCLIPFQILRPVSGNMFFGRSEIIDQLLHRPQAGFAIAGPGGIGKSSILAQYQHLLQRNRDPRIHRLIAINLKGVQTGANDAVARRIAMAVSPSSHTYYDTTAEDLPRILQQQSVRLGGPLDLLIDEVDEACQTDVFAILADAAKNGYCRLVLCGRGILLRVMSSADSALMGRLQLLLPEPLPAETARDLILLPFDDLGFRLANVNAALPKILRLTGRIPHYLQFFLGKLANYCIDERHEMISQDDIEAVTWDFESAQFFTAPLRNIRERSSYKLALLLMREMKRDFSIPDVCRVAARHGVELPELHAFELCSDLLVNNVLSWGHGACFRIANGALVSYAHRLGLLPGEEEASQAGAVPAAHEHGLAD